MVLGWLKRLLGKEDVNAPVHSKLGSTHTMGPEELLKPEEDPEMETRANTFDSETLEEYAPIHPVHETKTKFRTRADDEADEEMPAGFTDETKSNTNIPKSEALAIMEGALFMAGKGMSVDALGKVANIPLLKARSYIPELVDAFNARDSALEIAEDAGGYRMRVRAPYDEKVAGLAGAGELNPAEMKTLAFIAYKQPLLQSQLVQVRSNTAYEHLQVLVNKGFISREPKGRSYLLRTTKKFSEYFGTHSLKLKPMVKENSDEKPDHTQAEELS